MKEYEPFNQEEFNRWISSGGDSSLRLNYPLNENSVVFDLGGYKGEWSEKIYSRYNCKMYIFEPVQQFFNMISNKFSFNPKIRHFDFALSDKNGEAVISSQNDASSLHAGFTSGETIRLKKFSEFLEEQKITNVDLIKINIEGEEYNLLEDLIDSDKLGIFDNIQVQFHRTVENCVERRNKIREALSKTHEETYNFEFIWENWKRK